MRRAIAAALAVLALLLAAGCDRSRVDLAGLRIMVPNVPGSGYDITARTVAKALEDAKIVRDPEVFNLPGTSGIVGLQRLVYERGNAKLMMLMGLGLVASEHTVRPRFTVQDTTPIARLVAEPGVIVVTKDSPYTSLDQLVAAWRADTAGVRVGGGSIAGGPDHLATMLLAKAVGIAPNQVGYLRYDGGGELLAAILGRRVAFGVSGVSETADQVRSGQLRPLAVTGAQPVTGIAAPTLREVGIDVVSANWRGIVAPPGLSEQEVTALRQAVAKLHASPQWTVALARNSWSDAYLAGEDFAAFMRQERTRLAGVLDELGL